VGYLTPGRSITPSPTKDALVQGLRDLDYVDGENVVFSYRFIDDTGASAVELAAELVQQSVDVIVAVGTGRAQAAKSATSTIPIVMLAVSDPIEAGLVDSLRRPGGNVTGMSTLSSALAAKRLELLKDAIPTLTRVAALSTPAWKEPGTSAAQQWNGVQSAAGALGLEVSVLETQSTGNADTNEANIGHALDLAFEDQPDAITVLSDALFDTNRTFMAKRAAELGLPLLHTRADYIDVGGWMAFGPSPTDQARRAAAVIDKVLKGANPAELPVEQPTEFDLAINLNAARALGLTIPLSVVRQATQLVG